MKKKNKKYILILNKKKFIIRGLYIYNLYNNLFFLNKINKYIKYINSLKILINIKKNKNFIFIKNVLNICIKNNIILIIQINIINKINFFYIIKYIFLIKRINKYTKNIIINFNNKCKNINKWIYTNEKILSFLKYYKISYLIIINYPKYFYKTNSIILNKFKKFMYLKKNIIISLIYKKKKNILDFINYLINKNINFIIEKIKCNKNILYFCQKKRVGWIYFYKKKDNKIINYINGIRHTSIKYKNN